MLVAHNKSQAAQDLADVEEICASAAEGLQAYRQQLRHHQVLSVSASLGRRACPFAGRDERACVTVKDLDGFDRQIETIWGGLVGVYGTVM